MIPEKKLKHEIKLPDGVKANISEEILTVEGPRGKVSRSIDYPLVEIKVEDNKIKLAPKKFTRNEKILVNTLRAHVKNMIAGVQNPYTYRLKVCSSHFPMTASVEGEKVIVKNLFGEKIPRKAKILKGVSVKIDGNEITVTGPDLEAVGQTAANIEQSTRITNRDRRVFADGIWITKKAGD